MSLPNPHIKNYLRPIWRKNNVGLSKDRPQDINTEAYVPLYQGQQALKDSTRRYKIARVSSVISAAGLIISHITMSVRALPADLDNLKDTQKMFLIYGALIALTCMLKSRTKALKPGQNDTISGSDIPIKPPT